MASPSLSADQSPPIPGIRLHHLALVTGDLLRSERFYADLLGLVRIRRQDDERGPRSIWLDLGGGAFLALERAEAPGPTRTDAAPGLHCLSLAVSRDDRVRVKKMLESAGHSTVRETTFTFYVRDPDGVLVGLSHYPDVYSV